ncbi:MAG: 4'-phosphopantetheinyl transferase superfamily protein [Planctomycetota bacterium]
MTVATGLAERLFGASAAQVRFAFEPVDDEPLFVHPDERLAVARAVPKRQREYATGRRLAHALLAEYESPFAPLLSGDDRAPLWPAGLTGSISHGAGHCAVVVARTTDVRAIGVDVEDAAPLEEHLWTSVLSEPERDRLVAHGRDAGAVAKVCFSAKEAVYKAIAREVGRVLEFHEVELELDIACRSFVARHDRFELDGTVVRERDFVATAVVRTRA